MSDLMPPSNVPKLVNLHLNATPETKMAGADDDAAFDNIADPDLPFITVRQARRIRSLVRTAFAESGREVTAFSDHVRDDRGGVFGLWNVASACGSDPGGEKAWPRVARAGPARDD
jgi:hypothetical protein